MRKKLTRKITKAFKEKDLKEVMKGGAVAFLYRIATMGVSYFLLFFISRKLGKDGVGVFNICLATSGILVMVGCIGFNTSIVRFVSQYRSQKFNSTIRLLYDEILKYASVVSVVLAVLLYFLAPFLSVRVFEDPELVNPLRITAVIVPLMVLATINVEFIRGLKMVQISEYLRNLNIQVVTLIGTFIAGFFVLTASTPLIFYAVGAFISLGVGFVVILRFFKSTDDKRTEGEPDFSFKSHLIISYPMIITAFVQLLNGKVDTLMLASFESTAVVGVFSMAFKLSVITNFVIGALKTIAMPKVSELFWAKKMKELNTVLQYSTAFIFAFALPISLLLFVFPEFILSLIKDEFIEGSTTLKIFAVSQLINAASGMVAVFLNMSGNQMFFTRVVIVTTLLNIGLNYILIPIYGMEGAAVATFVSTLIWNLSGVWFIYRKYKIKTFFNPFSVLKSLS
jgi:O-antigen/teichoic acid export membrane protein